MKNFTFNIPTEIIFGKNTISKLKDKLNKDIKKVLIITDETISKKTDILKTVKENISELEIEVYNKIEENPSFDTINEAGKTAGKFNPDVIIGLGGGSSMDAAKGIAVKAANEGNIEEYISGRKIKIKAIPIVCIPTTSGTGSELTPFAIFTDKIRQIKTCLFDKCIFPEFSIIDPELTYSMPRNVTVSTGLDVLAHSAEAYLSTDGYDLNDIIALRSIELVIQNLAKASENDRKAMDNMAYASILGGIAITHASTILPHIMGYPLTIHHNMPHGQACTVVLPSFLDFMKKHSFVASKINKLESLFKEAGGAKNFIENLGISCSLSDYNISESEFREYAKQTIVKGDVKITPAKITEDIIFDIYMSEFSS